MLKPVCVLLFAATAFAADKGILLENLTWVEAERVLRPETVVVIPIGAESKEHGPHLPLRTDFYEAQYLTKRILAQSDVVVAPTVNYNYYPAFVEYPGTTTLRLETARDLMIDICTNLARYGPHRFYFLNTGVSTLRPLRLAAAELLKQGIVMRFTDLSTATQPAEDRIKKEEGGTHAEEIETSMMLFIAPEVVDMKKAVKDYHEGPGGLTRDPKGRGSYSASGIYGDATLATREKGEQIMNQMVVNIAADIEKLRRESVP
jgi:creatinine amidohydrolase